MQPTRTCQPLLEEYLIRLELVLAALGEGTIREVVSSKDVRLARYAGDLRRLAEEARRWQEPFGGDEDLLTSVTIAGPGGEIGPAFHPEGDAVRFVLSGSVWFGGAELGAGEWLLIPAGRAYRLRVGYRGAISLTAIYQPAGLQPEARAGSLQLWAE